MGSEHEKPSAASGLRDKSTDRRKPMSDTNTDPKEDEQIDDTLDDTFPASDPPSTGGSTGPNDPIAPPAPASPY
jgi:hypothetical protein